MCMILMILIVNRGAFSVEGEYGESALVGLSF